MRMGKPSIAVMVAVVLMVLAAEAIAAVHEGRKLARRSAEGSVQNETGNTDCSRNGRDGLTGRDGTPGLNGRDGLPGLAGRDGEKGEQGLPGQDGRNGGRGTPGIPGRDGARGVQGPPGPVRGGETYVRWGRTACPNVPGTELVYTGWAAGSHYTHKGGGANYLCLTKTPQYLQFNSATNDRAIVYGAEYEAQSGQPYSGLHDNNVPCTVCRVAQRSVIMIPGQYTCPTGWTREYYGYLVSEYHDHHRSTHECMDVSPETIVGGHSNQNGALFYHVEARCGSLSCPPYENTKELTCAVCSK